jgi:hypothetical protein
VSGRAPHRRQHRQAAGAAAEGLIRRPSVVGDFRKSSPSLCKSHARRPKRKEAAEAADHRSQISCRRIPVGQKTGSTAVHRNGTGLDRGEALTHPARRSDTARKRPTRSHLDRRTKHPSSPEDRSHSDGCPKCPDRRTAAQSRRRRFHSHRPVLAHPMLKTRLLMLQRLLFALPSLRKRLFTILPRTLVGKERTERRTAGSRAIRHGA